MCEGGKKKCPSFGLPNDEKRRWRGACAGSHEGVVSLRDPKAQRMCEGCNKKRPTFGLVFQCQMSQQDLHDASSNPYSFHFARWPGLLVASRLVTALHPAN